MKGDFDAWNRFVMESEPSDYSPGDIRRDAAIANLFSAVANNGGLVHFLDCANEFGGDEVVASLKAIGATRAAIELEALLAALGEPLLKTASPERKRAVARLVTEQIELQNSYSQEADQELELALQAHVKAYSDHYKSMR